MGDQIEKPLVSILGLSKWYADFNALHNINLTVSQGEKLVICGPSGSGKSTLIRCINQLEAHQKGTIFVDDLEVTPGMKNLEYIRRDIGMVFQNFNLFPHKTILENLMLGPIRNRGISKKDAEIFAMQYLE
ncbi:MAG: ATP-binding cassette domain-containing protein, partial [Paracoccaceae bacterium]|nr:ATP-binding cassette domain-containing protein [Paracoccaceae bacterium]